MFFCRFLLIIYITTFGSFTLKGSYSFPVDSIPENTDIFTIVEEMPSFPEGQKALYKFIENNLQYPKAAYQNKISGTVYVRFIITPKGNLVDIKVLRGIPEGDYGTNKEVIRLIESMPNWNSGKHRGQEVYCTYTLPIRFKLKNARKFYNNNRQSKEYKSPSNMEEKMKVKTSSKPTTITSTSPPKTKAINVKKSGQSLEDKAKTKIPTSSKPDTPPSNTIPVIEEGENIELDKVGPDGVAVYKTVPEMPTFPDGQIAFFRFIGKNVSYPPDARENNVQGSAYVGFTVMEDGSLKNFHIKQGLAGGPSCDAEALRVMQLSPDWNPGTINGKPVRVSLVTPIRFILNNNSNQRKGKRVNKFYRNRN